MGKFEDMMDLDNESVEVLVNDEKFSRMSQLISERSLRGMMRKANVKSFNGGVYVPARAVLVDFMAEAIQIAEAIRATEAFCSSMDGMQLTEESGSTGSGDVITEDHMNKAIAELKAKYSLP
jgi:hypothetical protein